MLELRLKPITIFLKFENSTKVSGSCVKKGKGCFKELLAPWLITINMGTLECYMFIYLSRFGI